MITGANPNRGELRLFNISRDPNIRKVHQRKNGLASPDHIARIVPSHRNDAINWSRHLRILDLGFDLFECGLLDICQRIDRLEWACII